MNAEICCGVRSLPSMLTDQSVPMWRFTDRMVRSGLVTACRLATSPTRTSPFLANATTLGVVREPSALAITLGSPPSRTVTTLLVVPRSMPTARAMKFLRWMLRHPGATSPQGARLNLEPLSLMLNRGRRPVNSRLREGDSTFFPDRAQCGPTYAPGVLGRLQDRRGAPNLRTRVLAGVVILGLVLISAPLVVF